MSGSQRLVHLCRLCECPAADSGVPMDAFDAKKLAEWCSRKLGADFDITASTEAACFVICQFCIWEARLDHENSLNDCSNSEGAQYDWWTGHDKDQNYKNYFYQKSLIQPCSVSLKKISSYIIPGDYSGKSILDLQSLEKSRPVKTISVSYFACKTAHCALKFSTEAERLKHEVLVHFSTSESAESTKNLIKCIYCGMFSNGIKHMSEHVRRQHKHAIKCGNSKIEKRKPANKMSTKLRRNFWPCIYCQKIYRNLNTLGAHIKNAHAAISFKCRFRGCHQYFFSQAEMKAHYCQKHQLEESFKNYHCPNCSYKSNNKSNCLIHFKRSHFAAANAFSSQESLKRHLKIFQEERCTCEHCGKMLLKSSLAAHFLGEKCKGLVSK